MKGPLRMCGMSRHALARLGLLYVKPGNEAQHLAAHLRRRREAHFAQEMKIKVSQK